MAKISKTGIFLKKGLGSTNTPYWSLTSCKISKKSNEPILSNIQINSQAQCWASSAKLWKKLFLSNCSAHFCSFFTPLWGKHIFFQKSDIIILNVLWYSIFMQKKLKKKPVKRFKRYSNLKNRDFIHEKCAIIM